jgi:hypothetical protein
VSVLGLLRVLLAYAVRGRGRERLFVVTNDLPDTAQAAFDDRHWAVAGTYPARHGGFVVLIVRPDVAP